MAARSASSAMCFAEMPVEIPLGERRVVPRQRRQHLLGIARRRLVGLADRLGAFDDRGARPAHPHRADVLLRMRRCRVHPDAQTVLDRNTGSGDRATARPRPRRRPPRRARRHAAPRGRGRARSSTVSSKSSTPFCIGWTRCSLARAVPPSRPLQPPPRAFPLRRTR